MKLFSQNANSKQPTFWVENYNEKEKEVFLKLGFEEKLSKIPQAFRGKNDRGGDTLQFKGSGFFGMFSEEEYNKIVETIFKEILPSGRKRLTIHQDYEY